MTSTTLSHKEHQHRQQQQQQQQQRLPSSLAAPSTPTINTSERKTLVESQMELNATNLSTSQSKKMNNNKMASWNSGSPKAASTANAVRNAPSASSGIDSPISSSLTSHHGQRPSLAGFDPFSTEEVRQPSALSPTKRSSSGSAISPASPHVDSFDSKTLRELSLMTASAKAAASPRKGALRTSKASRDHSPSANEENDVRQLPPTPTSKSPRVSIKTDEVEVTVPPTTPTSSTTTTTPRSSSKTSSKKKERAHSAAKLLSFVRKGHRRVKSLDVNGSSSNNNDSSKQDSSKDMKIPDVTTLDTNQNLSDLDVSGHGSKNGIVQDLMDLKDKFIQLQIPTLAKPSPTSFLTGKGDEAVRTSEYEPSPFQMEIPSLPEVVEVARLNEFVENYRRMDQNLDLQQLVGHSSLDLQQIKIKEHIPIAQALMECGDGLTIQGFLSVGSNADDRLEAVVFEGQRYFTVIFRGTTEQQTKVLGNSKSKKKAVPLDPEQEDVEVYSGFKDEYSKVEQKCFDLIDKLTEQNPFCDVVFSGYSFGAAMATLAASRYAMARPMMRVGCYPVASPKVGFSMFRHVVNSLPNLKVARLEVGQDVKCQGPTANGWHVGHTLVLSGSIGNQAAPKMQKAILAYKFDAPKHKKFKTTHPDLRTYINILEEIARLNIPWINDFVNTAGKGVVVNNEARLVV